MTRNEVNSVLLSTVIASNVYTIPVQYPLEGTPNVPVTAQNYLITGTGTLARNVTIRMQTGVTPKDGWTQVINWRSNLTVGSYTLVIQSTDYTSLLSGAASQDFLIQYFNGSWEVSNIDTTITGRLTPYALISSISGYISSALAAFTGSSAITTLGTIATGVWHGTAITDGYIASASTWNAKAPLASPALTGTPTSTTAATGTNTTQIATTAFVQNQFGAFATYNAVAWAASIDLTGLVGDVLNTVAIGSITNNTVINADVFSGGSVSEITFILPFGGAHTVTAGTNMSFTTITGVSTHTSILTVAWDAVSSTYIQKSFSQN